MDPYTAALHHNQTTLQKLRVGDMVEFKRGLYSHWGVYIGNEEIVHLTGDENDGINGNVNSGHLFTICGKNFNKAYVKKDKFWDVVLDSKAYKNNDKDKKLSPLSATEIVELALSKIGEIGYNVLWSNCEHFAALCRYGQMKSDQISSKDKPQRDKPKRDKPKRDKPQRDKPKRDKQQRDKPQRDKPQRGKPQRDKPQRDKPKRDKPQRDKPQRDKPKRDKPQRDKPQRDKPKRDKPQRDKPKRDKQQRDKPQRDKPQRGKPQRDKPKRDKQQRDKPQWDTPI
ncbi:hypothetical protein FSP39_023490 [Pinctada imbricata]|uniref:LRAT domain-containing protein n=1 Tax=Pinctada imbricata TaxID=66713 RepID=A0AA88XW11_PINIB|nr:hypothetical protein FSP39_023490 [Pinctada imbricata]